MVNGALSIGGILGVLLSGAFLYWEVGRFAEPQVPRTLFNERKEVVSYVVGLFVGIPLAIPLLLLLQAYANGALVSVLIDVLIVVAATEVAQWILLRLAYFQTDQAGPFYALGFRAGVAGILVLAVVSSYLSGLTLSLLGVVAMTFQAIALVALSVAGALLSIGVRQGPVSSRRRVPVGALAFGVVGLILIGSGQLFGPEFGIAAALVAFGGSAIVYRRLRDPVLSRVRPPKEFEPSEEPAASRTFGRTDR